MPAQERTRGVSLRRSKPTPTAAAQLRAFIAKFSPHHQREIRAVRRWMRQRVPAAIELVYDNYNFFVIGYSPTERPSDAVLSIAASANGIGLCFIRGKGLPDPDRLLRGAGNQVRSIHLSDPTTLEQPAVRKLVDLALAQSRTPFASSGRGKLVIRSVSAKQRPRRRTA